MGIVTGLAVLSILVIVHEFGHFLLARFNGVRVLAFSVGFGPVLLKKTIGSTEFRLSLVPFGGYVKMKGQEDMAVPEGSGQEADDYRSKTLLQRASIILAGPLFNYLLALAVLTGLYVKGMETPVVYASVVGFVADSSAGQNGTFLPGDTILTLENKKIRSWEDFLTEAALNPDRTLAVGIGRSTGRDTLALTPKSFGREKLGMTGLYIAEPAVLGTVQPGSAAMKAGLKEGDTVTAINGEPVAGWSYLVDRIMTSDSLKPLSFSVRRNGSETLTVPVLSEYSEQHKRRMVGIQKDPLLEFRKFGPVAAVQKAFIKTVDDAFMIGRFLKALVTAQVSVKGMAGPVGIVQLAGEVSKHGLANLLLFLAMISVNLAVVNLFPFLIITDGGVLFFLVLEKLRGRPLSEKTQGLIQQIAIAGILGLTLFITWNDLVRLFTGGF